MPTTDRNSRIKRDRRAIIGALNYCYPGAEAGEALYRIILGVNPEYTRTFLVRDMTYLRDKGYVEVRGLHGIEPERISVGGCAFALTATGTDVANQMVRDAALDV